MNEQAEPPETGPAADTGGQQEDLRTISSEELLKGCREILIRHAGEVYRLRLTRNGKLILQK